MFIPFDEQSELYHHGILGMHWGIRRYQPYPSGEKKGKEVGAALKVKQRPKKRKLSKDAKMRAKMRNEIKNAQVRAELEKVRSEAPEKKSAENKKVDRINKKMAKLKTKTDIETAEANLARQTQAHTEAKLGAKVSKYEARRRSTKFAPLKTEYGKQKAITSGNAKKVKRYAKYMTNDEYRRAIDRCNMVSDMHMNQVGNLTQAGKKILDFIGTAADMTSKGITLHDNIATIKNARLKAEAEKEGITLDKSKLMRKWKNDVNYKDINEAIRAADNRQRFYNTHGYDYAAQNLDALKAASGKSGSSQAGVSPRPIYVRKKEKVIL